MREEAARAAFREHSGTWEAKPFLPAVCLQYPLRQNQCQLKGKFKGPKSTFTEQAKKGEVGADSVKLVIGPVHLFYDSASICALLGSHTKTTKKTISA